MSMTLAEAEKLAKTVATVGNPQPVVEQLSKEFPEFTWKYDPVSPSIQVTPVTVNYECGFCLKDQHQAEQLFAGVRTFICDECVRLLGELLDLGPTEFDKELTARRRET